MASVIVKDENKLLLLRRVRKFLHASTFIKVVEEKYVFQLLKGSLNLLSRLNEEFFTFKVFRQTLSLQHLLIQVRYRKVD